LPFARRYDIGNADGVTEVIADLYHNLRLRWFKPDSLEV
jgi:hypothetical protein